MMCRLSSIFTSIADIIMYPQIKSNVDMLFWIAFPIRRPIFLAVSGSFTSEFLRLVFILLDFCDIILPLNDLVAWLLVVLEYCLKMIPVVILAIKWVRSNNKPIWGLWNILTPASTNNKERTRCIGKCQ